ncbi:hypothetical protein BGC99_002368 [Escherichia coli]|nr:hypothetical protein [Escherichia coli]EGJ9160924.1 hypothetical protein [Escherichia coli]ELE4576103.1 hypothetical protein [Escherichia coli]
MNTTLAKDIEFTAKSKRATPPVEYETRIIDVCQVHGWIYRGFVLPVKTPFQKTQVCIEVNGKVKTPQIQAVLHGRFTGKDNTPPKKKFRFTEEEHLENARKFYKPIGWDVLGCAEPYQGVDTKLILRCKCHGKIHKKGDLHNNRRQGGLTCPLVRGVLKSIQNGKKQVIRNKFAKRPMHFYLIRIGEKFFKFGITTRKNPLQRMREHQKHTNEKITFEYSHLFTTGWQASDLEIGIKKNIKGKKIPRKIMNSGFTETLPIDRLKDVKSFINEYIATNPSKPIYFGDDWENIIDLNEEDIERDLAQWMNAPLANLEPEDLELDLSPLDAL